MKLLVQAALSLTLVGSTGEWVTSERTGMPVCQLQHDVTDWHSLDANFCGKWRIPQPKVGEPIAPFIDWVRCPPGAGMCQLHFKNGWRP